MPRKKRMFTKQELKIVKYNLMKRGYTAAQADEEIKGMVITTEKNHERAMLEKRVQPLSFEDEFKLLKDGGLK